VERRLQTSNAAVRPSWAGPARPGPAWPGLVIFVIMAIVLLVRPAGLMGRDA